MGSLPLKVLVTQSCPAPCNPMDCCLPGSSGILQARILEWIVIPFSRGSSWPRDWTRVSCTTGRFFTVWATREAFIQTEWEETVYKQWDHNRDQFCWCSDGIEIQRVRTMAWSMWQRMGAWRLASHRKGNRQGTPGRGNQDSAALS